MDSSSLQKMMDNYEIKRDNISCNTQMEVDKEIDKCIQNQMKPSYPLTKEDQEMLDFIDKIFDSDIMKVDYIDRNAHIIEYNNSSDVKSKTGYYNYGTELKHESDKEMHSSGVYQNDQNQDSKRKIGTYDYQHNQPLKSEYYSGMIPPKNKSEIKGQMVKTQNEQSFNYVNNDIDHRCAGEFMLNPISNPITGPGNYDIKILNHSLFGRIIYPTIESKPEIHLMTMNEINSQTNIILNISRYARLKKILKSGYHKSKMGELCSALSKFCVNLGQRIYISCNTPCTSYKICKYIPNYTAMKPDSPELTIPFKKVDEVLHNLDILEKYYPEFRKSKNCLSNHKTTHARMNCEECML